MKALRQSTIGTLGLGSVLEIFSKGKLPYDENELVEKVFGPANKRGALVISGGNGIVGSGKAMQLGSRLLKHNVPIVTLDLPDAPDGLGKQYPGLKQSFGAAKAGEIMANIIRLNYDGASLPPILKSFNPRFLLEAIPEILHLKRTHYELFRKSYPDIQIRSVTSGFPSSELGVEIFHPSFPHQINKVWEVVEKKPSDSSKLLLALGLIPIPVEDYWSFILDVLFCGITLSALKYHQASNTPYWKIDKSVRRLAGPNPLRAHDAIGPGANFLTWSCLHHLAEKYGELFRPTSDLVRRKNSGETWYSTNRPIIDWQTEDDDELKTALFGPLVEMTSLLLQEKRAHLSHFNAIGELCAQFNRGILAVIRRWGADNTIALVEKYRKSNPDSAKDCWYPEVFKQIDSPEWQQLYVNAEYEGKIGVITISREALNWDVIEELNRAIDWLKTAGVERVILTGDFHLSSQMIGADISEFYPGLKDSAVGFNIAKVWSETARRFHNEFEISVGFINGKRCLGGMLELMMHCHYLVSVDSAQIGMPEITLPVIPGMEGCHWMFRKADEKDYGKIIDLLFSGNFIPSKDAVGWLVDFSGDTENAIKTVWKIVNKAGSDIPLRKIKTGGLEIKLILDKHAESYPHNPVRKAFYECILASCQTTLAQSLEIQARHSAEFMTSKLCRRGQIGSNYDKIMS